MSWLTIISALLSLFGPVLIEWLQRWLDDLFQRARMTLNEPLSYGVGDLDKIQGAAKAALFDAAIQIHAGDRAGFWWFQWFAKARHDRRAVLLKRLKETAMAAHADGRRQLLPAEAEMLSPLVEEAA